MSRALADVCLGDIFYVVCNLRADEWEGIYGIVGAVTIDAYVIRCMMHQGPKWTYRDQDRPWIVGGFVPQRSGVYASWFLATLDAWAEIPREVTDVAIERKQFMLDNGAHRIETVCLSSNKLAQRWYKAIGFKHEATLEAYCVNGTSAELFVHTKGVH